MIDTEKMEALRQPGNATDDHAADKKRDIRKFSFPINDQVVGAFLTAWGQAIAKQARKAGVDGRATTKLGRNKELRQIIRRALYSSESLDELERLLPGLYFERD